MKKSLLTLTVAALAALVFTGCTSLKLPEGRYGNMASDEYAIVQDDYLFLHLRAPQQYPDVWMHWNWAGKYSLSEEGIITPDMDKKTRDLWHFYFDFRYDKQTIRVVDPGNNAIKTLILEAPQRR